MFGGDWFAFGVHSNGRVDIVDGNETRFTSLSKEQASKLIALREKFMADVEAALLENVEGEL